MFTTGLVLLKKTLSVKYLFSQTCLMYYTNRVATQLENFQFIENLKETQGILNLLKASGKLWET